MSKQFSKDGKYFAEIATDGKLKIWETATSTFKQELTPNFHLTTPCTCLQWIQVKMQKPWKKRKLRQSAPPDEAAPFIALGTSSGDLLLYSFASAQIESTINSNTGKAISCITWDNSKDHIFAGANKHIIVFDVKQKTVACNWLTENETVNSIVSIPNRPRILTACRTITLWNLITKDVIKTFVGHSSNVTLLRYIPSKNGDPYFVSGSQDDRLLSCWSLSEDGADRNAVASLLMEDAATCLDVVETTTGIHLAAVTRTGVAHIYQYALNGKCGKPVKPKVIVQVVSDAGRSKDVITPIPIVAAAFNTDHSLTIAHGNNLVLTFENFVANSHEKVQCLIRKDPNQIQTRNDFEVTKHKKPAVDKTVDYLTPYTTSSYKVKRKADSNVKTEVPMEQRLENLTLKKLDSGVPKQDNVAQLLVQGLHSKDKTLLQTVLSKRDETVIKNTIRRLPMQVIVPLLTELTTLLQGKTLAGQTGVLWLRHLIQSHASQLLSNPLLADLLSPLLGCIENRLALLIPLTRLRGRLDLLVSQISDAANQETQIDEALLLYKDQGSSDSESEDNIDLTLHSDSDNEWVEEENSGTDSNPDDDLKLDENNISDSEMSL